MSDSLYRNMTAAGRVAPRERLEVGDHRYRHIHGPSRGRDRRPRPARNAHTDMRTLRAVAPGARVDGARSAGEAAGPRD
nr:hypothetical protein StreXyl84_08020 [Streptomyces sp. Xyl84]